VWWLLLCWRYSGEQQLLEKRLAAAGFDLDKYEQLMRTRDRYKRYIALTAAHGQHDETADAAKNGKVKDG
jgi:hypothetical protein